ncbi:MAG TPA: hypothetical protein DIW41_08010 [Lachnospiraceae bacterium]|jgi:hypothetical protein|nr:hypothetical protein [Lachnospiraceae bacterium]
MSIIVNISAVLIGMALIVLVVKLMINKKFMESEAILWILIGLTMTIMGLVPWIIPKIAELFGIWYPPAILFGVAIIGLILIAFKTSVTISKQINEINELSMQVSLLNLEIEQMKRNIQNNMSGNKQDKSDGNLTN